MIHLKIETMMKKKTEQNIRKSALRLLLMMVSLCLLLPVGLTACSSDDEDTRQELFLHRWQLSMYVNKETGSVENAPQPDGSYRLSLKLKEDGIFIAYCARDWFLGEYSISGSNISFKTNEINPIDKIAYRFYEGFHPDYEKESLEYFERINSCSVFKVADNKLWLYSSDKKEYLQFNAIFE